MLRGAGVGVLRDTGTEGRAGLGRQAGPALGFRQRSLLPLRAVPQPSRSSEPEFPHCGLPRQS